MAKNTRLSPNKLAELKGEFTNLKDMDGYAPFKDDYKVESIQAVETSLDTLLIEETKIVTRLANIRDSIAEKGTEFAQKMKGARQQVIAQFGEDSAEVQALGLKRASDRLTRKNKPGSNTPNA